MCGIAGVLSNQSGNSATVEELRRMIAVLAHRGPDGYGFYRSERISLAHARLSIVDIAGGTQPLSNEDGSIWITFNGEIFNYRDLRDELIARGHRFSTNSDTEVIVHCYEEYGTRTWSLLNGQFAFALWDGRTRRLWLVRDRLGIVPLFYARVRNAIVFGSEAKALFAGGRIMPGIDAAALTQVFTCWSAAAPATVFAGVESVRPGEACGFTAELGLSSSIYWRPRFEESPCWSKRSLDEAADALEDRLRRSIALRLRADVPVGTYLSGGLDSSAIAALARPTDDTTLRSFAIRFCDSQFDETAEQRRMARQLGTTHHEVLCGSREISEALSDVVWHCETPLLRTAPVPLFLLSALVKQTGMRVVLTGEGADELFAGYDIFKEDCVRRFWARRPDSSLRPALLSRLYPDIAQDMAKGPLWHNFFGHALGATDHPFYSHLIRWRNTAWTLRLLAPDIRATMDMEALYDRFQAELPPGWMEWTPLARAQLIELQGFLSSYLLSSQGDRVAMAHGVEVRYPFLDPDVVEFGVGLPDRFKLLGLRDKRVLRRLGARHLPEQIWRRPKRPYRAPMAIDVAAACRSDHAADLLSGSALARFELVDSKAAGLLFEKARRRGGALTGERESMALVGVLSLQLLAHQFLGDYSAHVRRGLARLSQIRCTLLVDDRVRAPVVA